MQDLFELDLKDYNPEGKVFSRPSARAIVFRDGKVLLIYSKKYDYYQFPGGGIEKGEDPVQALMREVAEESGYRIIPSSVMEYGRVLRRNRDMFDETGIFEQENFYYFCDVSEETVERKLEGYEQEEGYTPVWEDPMYASRHNLYECTSGEVDRIVLERDARVLDLADLEIKKRERARKEADFVKALGHLDYAGMLSFVEERLTVSKDDVREPVSAKRDISYSRFEHTKRVLGWAKKLYDLSDCKDKLDYEAIIISAIFHDVGRSVAGRLRIPHALAGVPITREYLLGHGFTSERTEYICSLIEKHSDKQMMRDPDMDRNLLLLQEADLMDDMGALGIVMDCMITVCRNSEAHFTDCLDHILRFTHRIQKDNPMRTEAARRLWDEKTKLVCEFTDALTGDIEL